MRGKRGWKGGRGRGCLVVVLCSGDLHDVLHLLAVSGGRGFLCLGLRCLSRSLAGLFDDFLEGGDAPLGQSTEEQGGDFVHTVSSEVRQGGDFELHGSLQAEFQSLGGEIIGRGRGEDEGHLLFHFSLGDDRNGGDVRLREGEEREMGGEERRERRVAHIHVVHSGSEDFLERRTGLQGDVSGGGGCGIEH